VLAVGDLQAFYDRSRVALDRRPEWDNIALLDRTGQQVINLRTFDRYEVAAKIRERLDGAVRLVALTGYGLPEDEKRARDAGFDQHVVKPVDETTLRRLLS
jgi:CheY-like chemotaxis protein